MTRLLLIAVPLLGLSACNEGKQVEAENASVAEVAQKVGAAEGDAPKLRPGKWVSKVNVESIDIPGLGPDAAKRVGDTMRSSITGVETCLSPERAAKLDEGFFTGTQGNCRYERFSMDGGKMSAVLKCSDEGHSQTVEFDGDYKPESYAMRMQTRMEGSSPMTIRMNIEASRVGECDAAAN